MLRQSRPSGIFLRFLIVGGLSYGVNQLVLAGLYGYAFNSWAGDEIAGLIDPTLLLASCLALEVSIIVRFALNDAWTFHDRHSLPLAKRLYRSNLGSVVSPIIALVVVNTLTPALGVDYLIANSIGILLGLAWNWLWSSRIVWAAAVDALPVQPEAVAPAGRV